MNVAILWDIENVTPPAGTDYIQKIIDAVTESEYGKPSYAMAFGDWNKETIRKIAGELASCSFELIHLPRSKKNSADMSLVAYGVELIFQYPHISRYVLVSGDADFRPLLLSLRKYGKETWVICDVKNNASEELLKMADKYSDYREMIDSEESSDKNEDIQNESIELTKVQAFELFREAVGIMINEKKKPSHGSVKIKMKLLNSRFDENKLGYKSWNDFVNDAMAKTNVEYTDENRKIFRIPEPDAQIVPEVFKLLLKNIEKAGDVVLFTELAKKIDYRKYGYDRFKKLALDAEKRGYVTTSNNGLVWSIRKNQDY